MPWRGAGQTDRGHVRSTNQDAFAVLNTMQVWIVADGMGGHAGGEIASHLAVEAITAYFRQQPQPSEYPALSEHHLSLRLTQAIDTAHHAIRTHAQRHPHLQGMGTTVVVLTIVDRGVSRPQAVVAHVGDSRAYVIHESTITCVTRDHTVLEDRIRRGLLSPHQAHRHPLGHVLTRAVGVESTVTPDITTYPLALTDLILLCSDGLSKMLSDEHILQVVHETQAQSLEHLCQALIGEANRQGGEDNITVIAVRNEEKIPTSG